MNSDLEIEKGLSYKQLLQLYSDHFSLGYLNTDFKNKMALISMICYLTYQLISNCYENGRRTWVTRRFFKRVICSL